MNTFSHSGGSSAVPSIADLDGFSLDSYNMPLDAGYGSTHHEEFGFDPPQHKPSRTESVYSSPGQVDTLSLNNWPDFDRGSTYEDNSKAGIFQYDANLFEIDRRIAQALPASSNAIARYGQVTPPRSNSATSSIDPGVKSEPEQASKPTSTERKKRGSRSSVKDNEPPPVLTPATTATGRKRKNTKKTAPGIDTGATIEESKRRQSLEKNRLAAAKCRVNKKEKTEQLQRDSHEKAVHNAYLKDQVMRMKEEVQQMNALLLTHANCDGCKSPEEIRTHLNNLSNEFFAQHLGLTGNNFADFNQMQMSDLSHLHPDQMMTDDFFPSRDSADPSLLHPPLPDFNRSGDFDVPTPMQTD